MDTIEIVNYDSSFKDVFRNLNVEWISTYFKMEASDYKALDNPDSYILQNGGHILVALLNKEPVGVCALIKMDDPSYDFELAKMAVAPKAQGKKVGWIIGEAIKDKARSMGAKTLYLESNTILAPAISLYRKLGFVEVFGRNTPYERCNIQMALDL
jgi:GNAT superfamily N-acetyltransferase